MKPYASLLVMVLMLFCTAASEAVQTKPTSADAAQINLTIQRYYSLSHIDASCRFSPLNDRGQPTDRRMWNGAYRDQIYTKTFKSIFSRQIFAMLKKICVDNDKVTGILDFRLSDSEIDSDPSNYGNDVYLKIAHPVRFLQADATRARVRVDWFEMLKGHSKPDSTGRSDVVLVKEDGAWLVDDVYSLGIDEGEPSLLDLSEEDFERAPGVVHLRGE